MLYDTSDTIVACGTPQGRGAISIVRLSGQNAIIIAEQVFRGHRRISEFKSHTAHIGSIVDGELIFERVLLLVFRSPNSYTGEDLIEFHLHGGRVTIEWLLELLIKNGARLAHPGEFTFRALLNNKMDLIQAESIEEIIDAPNRQALLSSFSRLDGKLSETLKNMRGKIWNIYAELEATLNFPEDEIETTSDKIRSELNLIINDLNKLCQSYDRNRPMLDGIKVVIAGPKNAGKSSLFNAIIGENKAIVSTIPGTTRDVVEAKLEFNNIPIQLFDTAGLGEAKDELDIEGIKRSNEKMLSADLLLYVIDGSLVHNEILTLDTDKTILVINKIDIGLANQHFVFEGRIVKTSAIRGDGIDELLNCIKDRFSGENFELPLIGTIRQREGMNRILEHIQKSANNFK